MRTYLLPLLLLTTSAACSADVSHTEADKAEVVETAKRILGSLDRGEFDQVWENAGAFLKKETRKADFARLIAEARGSAGAPSTREAYDVGFASRIDPGLPEGDYSAVEVDCIFNGKPVTERLALVQEQDQWRLIAYFVVARVKPAR